MMMQTLQERTPVGRDPNDATWTILRYPSDWLGAGLEHVIHDAGRNVLELEPTAWPGLGSWLALLPVEDAAGNAYRSDPKRHLLLRRVTCAESFERVEGIGGRGWETGRLDTPLGLGVDRHGRVYIADSRNHRVQVVDAREGSVVAVLGAVDPWGSPLAGDRGGAMSEPVHVAIDPRTCHVYVADRGAGLIHVFDDRFRHLRSFPPKTLEPPSLPPRPSGVQSRPVAVRVLDDGSILVLDTSRPRMARMTAEGKPLPDVGFHPDDAPFPGGPALRPRFRPEGEAILGPLDGGVYDLKWHRILVDAHAPEGTAVSIQTFASNDATHAREAIPWAPAEPVPIPRAPIDGPGDEYQRVVLADGERWKRWRRSPYRRARPSLERFEGSGPSAASTVTIPWTRAILLRVDDGVLFERGGAEERHTIASIPATDVTFTASGTRGVYAAGARLVLVERGSRRLPGAPRSIHTLHGGESVDLSAVDVRGRSSKVTMPHAIAALLRPGDRVWLEQGADRMELRIESRADDLALNAAGEKVLTVTLADLVAGDFSTSVLRLEDTPGRLVADGLDGFGVHPVLHEEIVVLFQPDERSEGEETARILLADEETATLWVEPGSLSGAANAAWVRFSLEEPVASDRGQYLWIRLLLSGRRERATHGHAVATPAIRSVRALTPRLSYLSYLPATYARRDPNQEAPGAVFLERFLALFEGELTRVEAAYESVSRLLNPEAADEEWLRFIGSWMALAFDPSWPLERRRSLILEAAELFEKRGTGEGIRRYVEIYTGKKPTLLEGFQLRPSSALVLGRTGRVGCSTLGGLSCDYRPHAHRFTLFVFLDAACEVEHLRGPVRDIVHSMKPAHVESVLCFVPPRARVGIQSSVAVDLVLGDLEEPGLVLGQGPAPLGRRVHPVVGFDAIAAEERPPAALRDRLRETTRACPAPAQN